MSDPFAPNSNQQLIREAQRGFAIVAVLLAILAYVSFDRIFGRRSQLPEHVRNAPVAQTVWPYSNEPPDPAGRRAARADLAQANRSRIGFDSETDSTQLTQNEHRSSDRAETTQSPRRTDGRRKESDSGSVQQASVQVDVAASQAFVAEFPTSPKSSRPSSPVRDLPGDFEAASVHIQSSSREEEARPHRHDSGIRPVQTQVAPSKAALGKSTKPHQSPPKAQLDPFESSAEELSFPQRTPAAKPDANLAQASANTDSSPGALVASTDSLPVANDSARDFKPFPDAFPRANPPESQTNLTTETQTGLRVAPSMDSPHPLTAPSSPPGSTATATASSVAPKRANHALGMVPDSRSATSKKTEFTLHKVGADESYYSISQHYYGDGAYFRALFRYNTRNLVPTETLAAGTQLEVPPLAQLLELYPEEIPRQHRVITVNSSEPQGLRASPFRSTQDAKNQHVAPTRETRSYQTKRGETLFQIAAQELGQASRYLEILELNRDRLPENANQGTLLPADLMLLIPVVDP